MKHKLNEATLMAYLYGELSATEKGEVEKYFQENPDALREFQDLQMVKATLGKITDKEVITPPMFMDEKPTVSLWQSGFFRYVTGIAAAFFIVMIGAKLLGLQMQYSDNEFVVSFGEGKKTENAASLTPEQVQQLIDASLSKNNEFVQTALSESQARLKESFQQNSTLASLKVDELSKSVASASQEEIRQFMETLRNENNQVMQDYMRLSSNDQKQYIETILVDFAKYVQEQRAQDLNLVQTRLNSLEQDNTQFKEEAGQILTSLISNNNNNSAVKRN
jgi:acyl-CoA synthetase (AMP-forming)/AMP-acid ligase II